MREDIYRTNDDVETLMNNDYMISFQNETKQAIEKAYKNLTAVERSVADFFIGNKDDMDFSSKNISRSLYFIEILSKVWI